MPNYLVYHKQKNRFEEGLESPVDYLPVAFVETDELEDVYRKTNHFETTVYVS